MSTDGNPWGASRRWRRRAWLVIGLVGMGTLAFAFVPDIGSPQDSGPRFTHRITRGNLIVTVIEQGTLESAENTEIKCRIRDAGIPITWVIESGSKVEPGDVLVLLTTRDQEESVRRWVGEH